MYRLLFLLTAYGSFAYLIWSLGALIPEVG